MMIDFDRVFKTFNEYTEKFSKKDKITLKYHHMLRVMDLSEKIAKSEGLDDENIELAKLIGLLHDIGRYEQVNIYDTFDDEKSIDHANLGIEILFKDNYIRKFIDTNKYDEIIKKAILNHNKYQIEDGLNDIELIHAKIIRDADKIDIFKVCIDIYKFEFR